jgi:hypothetical protein
MSICMNLHAQHLSVVYGPEGLRRVTYANAVIADVDRWPEDKFHIWHMKAYGANEKLITTGQYGWGENSKKRTWDSDSNRWIYTFDWGTIRVAYQQHGDTLDVVVTTENRADSGIVMDGAAVYPLVLHLPQSGNEPHIIDGSAQPGVTSIKWMQKALVIVTPDAYEPIWSGAEIGKDGVVRVMASSTKPDSMGPGSDHPGLRVLPGKSRTFLLSLRFTDSDTSTVVTAADAYKNWSERWPVGATWKDRRVIGTVFLASSPQGNKTVAGGFPLNPRRYFNDPTVDITTEIGLKQFQIRLLAQAEAVVVNLKRLNAQGAVTWDIEGEEFPQDTSYVCAPDTISRTATELESIIGRGSRYAGMKLVDAYFKTIRDAGFRVGVCVRPQRFTLDADNRGQQHFLLEKEVVGELIRKIRYAHDRWGATIFYLDSTVREDGSTLDASVLELAAASVPDSLLIPEESSFRMYRTMAPFMTFLFHGDLTTGADIRAAYPQAFGINLINDVDPRRLAEHRDELVEAVRHGDVLMVHAESWQENNATVVGIYREASAGMSSSNLNSRGRPQAVHELSR